MLLLHKVVVGALVGVPCFGLLAGVVVASFGTDVCLFFFLFEMNSRAPVLVFL